MKKLIEKRYSYLKESVYQARLDNGLTVTLLPKPEFNETYGLMTTRFGAADTVFQPLGSEDYVTYPAGIAHFLEHKLFETEDGDIMQEFSRLGASSNAYTSLHQTSYLFSTTEKVLECLSLLQTFVREPYFTPENVEKEQGIIAQEIEMYADDVDYRLYTGILASLYPATPLAYDIAGSVESIMDITAQGLYENFETFYHPSNMHLFVIGNFDLEQVWNQIYHFQAAQLDEKPLQIQRAAIAHHPIRKNASEEFEAALPKLAVGIRGNDTIDKSELQKYRLSLQLLFSMLFGWTSQRYQSLYEAGKIDSSFSFQVDVHENCHHVILTGDTVEPITVSSLLRRAIQHFEKDVDLSEEHLQVLKNEMYGDFIRSLNSLEFTASHFASHFSDEESVFDIPAILTNLTLADVIEAGRQFIGQGDMTDFMIFPK